MAAAERIKALITEQLGVNASQVTDEADLINDLGADSLDVVELTMTLEEEFGFSITDDEMEGCNTVGEAIRLVESKQDA